jgi:hemerythrin-like domain-containing protein
VSSPIEFRSPDAGFDAPVEMWLACHERVRRFAALIVRLEAHVARLGADEEAQRSAASIRRYFNEAAPRHHEDEEVDLFPLLRERSGSAEQPALDALERIEAEHLAMAEVWRRLDVTLARISAGDPAPLNPKLIGQFASGYDRHIDIEENVVLPALLRRLSAADWSSVGRAMAERRGLDWDRSPAVKPVPSTGDH